MMTQAEYEAFKDLALTVRDFILDTDNELGPDIWRLKNAMAQLEHANVMSEIFREESSK